MGANTTRHIAARYERSPVNQEAFTKAEASSLSPVGRTAEFFAAVWGKFKQEKFLSGLGLDGDLVVPEVAAKYFSAADNLAAADAATYYVQKGATCLLAVLFEATVKLAQENPVRARALALLSTTAYQLAYCADTAVSLTAKAGHRLPRQPLAANPKTNRGLRTGQTTTNVISRSTHIEKYIVESSEKEQSLEELVQLMEIKLSKFGWRPPKEDQGPSESTKALSVAIKNLASRAAKQANKFYCPSERDVPEVAVKDIPLSKTRRSTRIKQFESEDYNTEDTVEAWGSKTMKLLIAYQNEILKQKTDNFDPKTFAEVPFEDHMIWFHFMIAQDEFSFTKLIEGHFRFNKNLKMWIDECDAKAKEILTVDFPFIFRELQDLNPVNSTLSERWIRFESQLAAYAINVTADDDEKI